jgi:hypothetical protein
MAKTAKSRRKTTAGVPTRRFRIHAPVHYRANGGCWHHGTTEDISCSRVLLHADEALPPNTTLQVVVDLPPVVPGEPPATLVCRGRVQRTVHRADIRDMLVAVSITECLFGRVDGDGPEPFQDVTE